MGLLIQLYLVIVSESILPYNLWVVVGMHNGAKEKVVDFVYYYNKGQKRNNGEYLPEAVVVKFHSLNNDVKTFVEEMTHTIAILVSYDG